MRSASAEAALHDLSVRYGVSREAIDAIPDRRRQWSRERSRRYQRSPDPRKSYERRHRLATMLSIPAHLAAWLTIGDRAVLKIVVDEIKDHGYCALTCDEIAARAGVCRKTVTRALMFAAGEDAPRELRAAGAELRLISIERARGTDGRNRPNVIRIISKEWLSWLRLGPRPARPGTVGQFGPTTVDPDLYQERGGQKEPPRAFNSDQRGQSPPGQNDWLGIGHVDALRGRD